MHCRISQQITELHWEKNRRTLSQHISTTRVPIHTMHPHSLKNKCATFCHLKRMFSLCLVQYQPTTPLFPYISHRLDFQKPRRTPQDMANELISLILEKFDMRSRTIWLEKPHVQPIYVGVFLDRRDSERLQSWVFERKLPIQFGPYTGDRIICMHSLSRCEDLGRWKSLVRYAFLARDITTSHCAFVLQTMH